MAESSPDHHQHHLYELNRKYDDLTHYWNGYLQSHPRHLHRCSPSVRSNVRKINQFLYCSPRHVTIPSVQRHGRPRAEWKVRNNDLAVAEILDERRAAIESGELKGRRLIEALESVNTMGSSEEHDICSACSSSSVLIQTGDVDAYYSSSTDDSEDVDIEYICVECYSSSSSVEMDSSDEGESRVVLAVDESGTGAGDGEKGIPKKGNFAFAVVLFGFLFFALCSLWSSHAEVDDHKEALQCPFGHLIVDKLCGKGLCQIQFYKPTISVIWRILVLVRRTFKITEIQWPDEFCYDKVVTYLDGLSWSYKIPIENPWTCCGGSREKHLQDYDIEVNSYLKVVALVVLERRDANQPELEEPVVLEPPAEPVADKVSELVGAFIKFEISSRSCDKQTNEG
ncbi:hypothetical protein Syun_024531 [Stephania yunnanensis]|uniref:Uncharacterized protein n=1 Tax=Stephania yunnanensis TaxID=152371 RepID=A0AAP0NJ96_9MAGN